MKVSVVVPAYNAGSHLSRLLVSLGLSRLDKEDVLEVVIADDGSNDNTSEIVKSFTADYSLAYVFLPRSATSGRASARNAGIESASGEVVLLVDADQICAPGFVAEHIRYHRQRTDLVVVGPRHDLASEPPDDAGRADYFTASSFPEVIARDSREGVLAEFSENFNNLETCWHHMFSCNVSVRREHLLAVGGFDGNFTGWGLEDCELGYRLRRAGLAFAYNSSAVSYQRHREVTPAMFVDWRRNLTHFMGKYSSAPDVAAQLIICNVFDPEIRSLDWLDGIRRFELAARALAGRLPGATAFEWIEANDANAAGLRSSLPERVLRGDLIVIDDTEAAVLADSVQCLDTTRELLYFHRPSPDLLGALRRRYPART
jgi:glycosyltransferase involved in cell wall biosynthesis